MSNSIYNFGYTEQDDKPKLEMFALTWSEIVDLFKTEGFNYVSEKPKVPGIVGCSMLKNWRCNDNVIARELFYLDVDDGVTIAEIEELMKDYTYLIYSTYSHDPDAGIEKFRLILPLAKPMAFEDWDVRRKTFIKAYPQVDPNSFKISQFMKMPVLSPVNQKHHFVREHKGNRLFDAYDYAPYYTKPLAPAPVMSFSADDTAQYQHAAYINARAFASHDERLKACTTMKALGFDANTVETILQMSGTNKAHGYWTTTFNKANTKYASVRWFLEKIGIKTKCSKLAEQAKANALNTTKQTKVSAYDQEFYLTDDQRLGDVIGKFELGYLNLVIADCGVGKNYTSSRTPNAWVVSPLRIIVSQNTTSANADNTDVATVLDQVTENVSVISKKSKERDTSGGIDNGPLTYEFTVPTRALCTWNMLVTMYNVLNDNDKTAQQKAAHIAEVEKLKNVTLFIDESHGLYLDYTFKGEMMSTIYEIIAAKLFKQVIFMSGTSSADDYHVKFDKVIRVGKEAEPKVTTRVIAEDVFSHVAYSVLNSTADGIVVYWNDCKQIDKLTALIGTEKKLLTVTADTGVKNHPDVIALKTTECLGEGYEGIIGTNSIVEGMNIKNEVDTVDVFVVGNEPVERIEQVSNRYRKAKTVRVYNVVSKTSPDLTYSILKRSDVTATANTITNALNIVLDCAVTDNALRYTAARNQLHAIKDVNDQTSPHTLIRIAKGEDGLYKFVPNYVGIDGRVSNSKTTFDSYNFESYKERLSKLNHHVVMMFSHVARLSKAEQEAIDEAAEENKAQRQADALKNVIDMVLRDTVEDAYNDMVQRREETLERDLLVKVLRVHNYINATDVVDMLTRNTYKAVLVDIERVKRENKIINYINANINVGDVLDAVSKAHHAEAIMNIWRNDKSIQAADVDLNKKAKYDNGVLEQKSATVILRQYLKLSNTKPTYVNGNTVRLSTVEGTTTSGYTITKQTSHSQRQLAACVKAKQVNGFSQLAAKRAAM